MAEKETKVETTEDAKSEGLDPGLHLEDGIDTASVFAEDDKFTQEHYEEIKARTMFNMVEEVSSGKQKLLFLTNAQADLLANPENIPKLMGSLELGVDPKLLIVLQWDGDSRRHYATFSQDRSFPTKETRQNGSFETADEGRAAETRLDNFMREVLIPLAVQTNAVILCDAVHDFELSASFLRMVSVQRASFGAKVRVSSGRALPCQPLGRLASPEPSSIVTLPRGLLTQGRPCDRHLACRSCPSPSSQ